HLVTSSSSRFFFSRDPSASAFYTLSLHDALPIWLIERIVIDEDGIPKLVLTDVRVGIVAEVNILPDLVTIVDDEVVVEDDFFVEDRKSTRLNSSHVKISYAVFCLKKKSCCDIRLS